MSASSISKWLGHPEISTLSTPFFLVDLDAIQSNLDRIAHIREVTGAKILHALKAYSSPAGLAHMAPQLDGAAVSSVHEAMMAERFFGKNLHAFAPAYSDESIKEILPRCSHINFNSISQLVRFKELAKSFPGVHVGLRVNPESPQSPFPIYDPSNRGSRLGATTKELSGASAADLEGIDCVHVHNLCEQGLAPLARTIDAVVERFRPLLERATSINLGGGHFLAAPDYDVDGLVALCDRLRGEFDLEIIMEPGGGIVHNSGILVTTVLDLNENEGANAITDSSASTHMPDVLEMPYQPEIVGAEILGTKVGEPLPTDVDGFAYRIGGNTCLSGDHIGSYLFPEPLEIGDQICFDNQTHYTIVKTTQFNGVPLPAIVHCSEKDGVLIGARPGFDHYAAQLG